MAILKNVSLIEFAEDIKAVNADIFSFEGIKALYDYFYSQSQEKKEHFIFYPIDICANYSEHSLKDLSCIYGLENICKSDKEIIDYLLENTEVIQINNSKKIIIKHY